MNRPIEFRFWDERFPKMSYMFNPVCHGEINFSNFSEAVNQFGPENAVHLMQFTGLLDRKGKKIFEGDIFGNIKQLRSVIEVQPNGAFELVFLDKRMKPWSILDPRIGKSVIMGNIYENPDLLKG